MKEITKEMVDSGLIINPFRYRYPMEDRGMMRFNYFLDRISSFEDNEDLRYDLAMRLKNIPGDIFWWIDYRKKDFDCFNAVLDELFDSDSYIELNNKLDAIESASYFGKVTKDTYYKLLDRLKSGKYKDQYQVGVKYKDGFKPDKLIDRMCDMYDESLKDVHSSAKSIEEMVLALGRYDYDYGLFCHNYIEKIEKDLDDRLSSFVNFPKGYENSKWEEECDIPFTTYLYDTCDWDNRKKYIISKFKELGLDKRFRDKFISCYDNNQYGFLNLYMIAIAYEFQKDNFDNFSAVLDDMIVIPDYCTEFTALDYFKSFVGYFIACEDYKDIINMRESFKFFLNNFDGRCYSDIISEVVKKCEFIIDCKDEFCKNEVYGLSMKKVFEGREIYFNPLFIWGKGRLSYINNKLYEIETNPSIRDEIFICLRELVVNPFNVLNEGSSNDSFFECMDIVFDSDTYGEMYKKIKAINKAGMLCENGKKIEGLEIIKNLNSEEYKEKVDDRVIAYPSSGINRVEKPKTIIGRMKYLYSRIEEGLSYDFLDDVHEKANWFEDIDASIIKHRNKLGNKVKRLVLNSRKNGRNEKK